MAHVHLIGIGGSGLSAIARVLLESGYAVSGSDRQASPLAQRLQEAGARVYIGHRAENIAGADLVVRSSAIPNENIEVQAAIPNGVPVLKRADFLGKLMEGRLGIAVAGTHGKTTTTAMIAWIFTRLGEDPSYIIGGVSKNLGSNAHAGQGRAFIIEADEYDRMFLGLTPTLAVVTNIEHDHPDCFPTLDVYSSAFFEFARRLPSDGTLLVCGDDPGATRLGQEAQEAGIAVKFFGTGETILDYRADNLEVNQNGGYSFDLSLDDQSGNTVLPPPPTSLHCSLQVPGVHNVRNAMAALAVAAIVELPLDQAAQALSEYQGTGRRFDILGEAGGVIVIDDYAHHPSKIRATLSAARGRYPKRDIWVVWQPHTYTRTRQFFGDFTNAFSDADHVLVTEIYPAREPVEPGFSARRVVESMQHPDAHFVTTLSDAVNFLLARLNLGSVLLVLSAGDADQISRDVLAGLRRR